MTGLTIEDIQKGRSGVDVYSLESLYLWRERFTDILILSELPNLDKLWIESCYSFNPLDFSHLTQLTELGSIV